MRFDEQRPDGALTITGYGPAGWRVGGEVWPDGVLVTPDAAVALLDGLTLAQLAPLAAQGVEVLLLGTGPTLVRDAALLKALAEARLAVDVMDSKAAARTYNVLVSEGRRVAAALLPV